GSRFFVRLETFRSGFSNPRELPKSNRLRCARGAEIQTDGQRTPALRGRVPAGSRLSPERTPVFLASRGSSAGDGAGGLKTPQRQHCCLRGSGPPLSARVAQ